MPASLVWAQGLKTRSSPKPVKGAGLGFPGHREGGGGVWEQMRNPARLLLGTEQLSANTKPLYFGSTGGGGLV